MSSKSAWFTLLVVVLVIVVIGIVLYSAGVLDGQGPQIAAFLAGQKTSCENRVQSLKAKGIDGEREYEKTQIAVDECVAFITVAIADRQESDATKQQIRAHLKAVQDHAQNFRTWADQKIGPGQTGDVSVDLGKMVLDFLSDQDSKRRADLIKELKECRFRSWHDIPAGTGASK